MGNLDQVFSELAKSRFRSRFKLTEPERRYLVEKGLATVLQHARDFIHQRLAPEKPDNDGRQTPLHGHPAFVAQHATATCCRSCLQKWHHIAKGKPLSEVESQYVNSVLQRWIVSQMPSVPTAPAPVETGKAKQAARQRQQRLF